MRRGLASGAAAGVLLFAGAFAGCGKPAPGAGLGVVLQNPSVTAPPLLRSEADQIAIPVRIGAPLHLENQSDVEQFVSVSKTGCSCYGMSTANFILQPGEQLKMPPRKTVDLFFVSNLLDVEGNQSFRVGLTVPGQGNHAGEELRAECSMKILPDVALEPSSMAIDLPRAEEGDEAATFPIVIKRLTRGRPTDQAPPEFFIKPELLKLEELKREQEVTEVEPGLWQSTWRATLVAGKMPEDGQKNGGTFAFTFEFPESSDEPLIAARTPSDGAQIPTAEDIIRPEPGRRAYGQLVFRLATGIVAPSQLHFGSLEVGSEKRSRRIVLTAADKTPFGVTVEGAPPQIEAEADSAEAAVQQWVTVTFDPAKAGEFEEVLTLKTSHPVHPEVRVTLKARVR